MASPDAVGFLQKRADRADKAGAEHLAAVLGCLPLALEQAAAFAKTRFMSFADYAAQVETLIGRGGENPDYPDSVAATFNIAITALASGHPSAEALLGLFAWLAPEAIPLSLADDTITPPLERADTVAALIGVSLLSPAGDTACGPAVSVHRLVQTVVRQRLVAAGDDAVARDRAVGRLTAEFPYAFDEPDHWPVCRVLLPHVRALEARLRSDEAIAGAATLLNHAASFLEGGGDAAGAMALYRRALESSERVLGPDHPQTLGSVSNLATGLWATGDKAGAVPLLRRAMEGFERLFGPDHPSSKQCRANYEGAMRETGTDGGGASRP